jgi:pilus assembly protein CpaB
VSNFPNRGVAMSGMGKKLILISLVLALAASAAVFAYLNSLKTSDKKVQEKTVQVAAENIPPRTLINKDMVKEIKVADDAAYGNYIKDSAEIIGKYSKETILENESFNSSRIIYEKAEELSIKIDSNNRAVSVSVTGDTGISDLLKPEDYVDISVYLAEKKENGEIIRQETAKIVLQNIRVLAVDKQINRNDNAENKDKNKDAESVPSTFLVTLSVPAADIEKLVLAESIGSLKLALRPAKDDEIINTDGTT